MSTQADEYTTIGEDELISKAEDLGMNWLSSLLDSVAEKAFEAGKKVGYDDGFEDGELEGAASTK